MPKSKKEYLGDGVYADFDGFNIKLTASDGVYDTDTIYLDPHVILNLIKYHEKTT